MIFRKNYSEFFFEMSPGRGFSDFRDLLMENVFFIKYKTHFLYDYFIPEPEMVIHILK